MGSGVLDLDRGVGRRSVGPGVFEASAIHPFLPRRYLVSALAASPCGGAVLEAEVVLVFSEYVACVLAFLSKDIMASVCLALRAASTCSRWDRT